MKEGVVMIADIEKLLDEVKKMYCKNILKNRLSKIEIHNLRKFSKNSQINFTFPLTVLVGKNGSGKTTLLKAMKLLAKNQIPQNQFFETAIDDGGFEGADISYLIDGERLQYKRMSQNEWGKEGNIPSNLSVTYIQTKHLVGAIDKSLLYDDVGKKMKEIQKIEYIIRQSKKILQNNLSNSERKQRCSLKSDDIKVVNWILQKEIQSIEIIRHKYYSGTWGTSIIFNEGEQYSEYNAGSGEFLIAYIVNKVRQLSENSLLLLDEPEVSLHPGAQRRLMCYILDIIKRKKIQVIIATHSTNIVDSLPKSSIKCLRKIEDSVIIIEEQVCYQNAFLELESDIKKKHIIVEDVIAKRIIEGVLKEEKMDNLLQVDFYPGGANNIKKYTLFTYAKTKIQNRYTILDGDQKKCDVPDFSKIPDSEKNEKYYKNLFKNVVGISVDKIDWGVDANRKSGRYNAEQEQELICDYLNYFKNNVFFLPKKIPEDIIYNTNFLKPILNEDIPDVSAEIDSKMKIKKISSETGLDIDTIVNILIYQFNKIKNSDYKEIKRCLNKIIEMR